MGKSRTLAQIVWVPEITRKPGEVEWNALTDRPKGLSHLAWATATCHQPVLFWVKLNIKSNVVHISLTIKNEKTNPNIEIKII